MDSSKIAVNRFKFFFIHAIDLGYLLESDGDVRSLQSLRARDELYNKLCAIFDNTHVTAFTFKDPSLEDFAEKRASLQSGTNRR